MDNSNYRGRKVQKTAGGGGLDVRSGEKKLPAKLMQVAHVMRLGTQANLERDLQKIGLSGRLNAAFIERVNLTVRHGVAALARRTWATAQQAPHLLAHLEWWRAYYHCVRPHVSLRVALVQPRERGGKLMAQRNLQRTPAMAAGRTNRRWTAREVLCYPLPPVPG
jgi:transposase InsO family protein